MTEVISFRSFSRKPEPSIRAVHSPFSPAEVYSNDRTFATIRPRGKVANSSIECQVFRLSPLGVELDVGDASSSELNRALEIGSELDLVLHVGDFSHEFVGLVVTTRHRDADRELCGIRWCEKGGVARDGVERRLVPRWMCSDDYLPTGIAPNPVKFNDYVYFKVLDLSSAGMQIITSLRNKFIVPGMILESMATFPLVGQLAIAMKIKSARIKSFGGKDYLALGTHFLNVDTDVLETIGQYMLQFGEGITPDRLSKLGFPVRSLSQTLEFSCVKTADDYREVLNLRRTTYGAVGKLKATITAEEAGDIFDTRARILTAKHRNVLVGSVRLMFHDVDDKTEHEQFVKLPAWFPRKDEYVEVTRFCTHKDYRGSDLLYALFKQTTLTVAQSTRRWITGSATDKMMPLYKKIGYQATGIRFKHESLGGEEHEMILGDITKIVAGVGVGPALWNELYADLVRYLRNSNGIEFDPLMNLRMSLYAKVAPLTALFTRGVRKPRKTK